MSKRVLDVGQCNADHGAISRFLQQHFSADVVRTHGPADTLHELRQGSYDLVLVNRKLDADYSDGLEIVRQIKADRALAATPVMLVTNYPEHQELAVAEGAVAGFGKAELHLPQTLDRVRQVLG